MPIPAVSAAASQNMQSAHDDISELKENIDALQTTKDWKIQEVGMAMERMSTEIEIQKLQIAALKEMND